MRCFFFGILMGMFSSCNTMDPATPKGARDLRTCFSKEPVSLDPRKGNDVTASQVHFMLFEGLVHLNADMSLSLGLAASYEVSSDGKTYVFHLRDARWSDGSTVTAYDFERSWKSILDPLFPSPDAYLLYCIKNARAAKIGKVSQEQIGIYHAGDKTFIVDLENPTPYFLQIVASSVMLPVNAIKDKTDPDWACSLQNFISNGPFRLKKWTFNQQLVLEKNPYYHKAGDVALDHIVIDILDGEMAVLELYRKGQYDLIGSPLCHFPHDQIDNLRLEQQLSFFPVAGTKFLAFNTASGVLKNAHIRRSLALAIPRQTLVEHITKLSQKEALNVLPPLFSASDTRYFTDGDAIQAKEAFQKGLKELQIDALGQICLMYVSSELNHILAQELQQIWSRTLGIDIILKAVDFKTLHACTCLGEYDIGLFAWLADYADPMSILDRFTDKTNHRNYPKWENREYNQLLQEAHRAASSIRYREMIKEAEAILIDEMPFTCLYHENFAFLIAPQVHNFTISPLGHIYFEKILMKEAR